MTQPQSADVGSGNPSLDEGAGKAPPRRRTSRRGLWACAALCLTLALVLVARRHAQQATATLPRLSPSSQSVPVPSISLKSDHRVERPAKTDGDSAILQLPARRTVIADASVAHAPTSQLSEGSAAKEAADRSQQILELSQRNSEALSSMSEQLNELKLQLGKLSARPKAAYKESVVPAASGERKIAREDSPNETSHLLSVDLWGGKPSIVMSGGQGTPAGLSFLNEGEKQGRATVRRAEIDNQRVILSTDKGDVSLSRDE